MKSIYLVVLLGVSLWSNTIRSQHLATKVVGEGKPIVFIPGLACHGDVWNETAVSLKEGYECHILTLPGFAGNRALENINSGFADQTLALIASYIEENELGSPFIVGHSLGGSLALKLGIEHPGLVGKLIIVDALPFFPAIRNPNITQEEAEQQAKGLKAGLLANARKPEAEKAQAERELLKWMIKSTDKIETVTEWYMQSDPETMAQSMYELNIVDLRAQLAHIKAPTLVLGSWIAGKDYGVTKEMSMNNYKAQYSELPNLTMDMTDIGFHFIMWDDPEFFITSVKGFLK